MKTKIWGLNYINMAVAIMFALIGIYMQRPAIVIISISIFLLGLWSRKRLRHLLSPVDTIWKKYISSNPEAKKAKYTSWHFGTNEKVCEDWLGKLKRGEIKGASYFAAAFSQGDILSPKPGDYSVVLDWWGKPQAIIKTTSVETVFMKDITSVLTELEDYSDVHLWKKEKQKEYERISEGIGVPFSEEIPILFERFELVFENNEDE